MNTKSFSFIFFPVDEFRRKTSVSLFNYGFCPFMCRWYDWRVMFLTQKFLLAAYNRIFGKCWAVQHERLQFWIYSHMCVALLGSILWQDPLSLRLPPTVSSVTFKPVSLHDEQWDAGRIHMERGGHPHCYYDHALNHCAMTASVFKCLEATWEQRLGALELKINWMKVLDLVWHVTCMLLFLMWWNKKQEAENNIFEQQSQNCKGESEGWTEMMSVACPIRTACNDVIRTTHFSLPVNLNINMV